MSENNERKKTKFDEWTVHQLKTEIFRVRKILSSSKRSKAFKTDMGKYLNKLERALKWKSSS